MYRLRVTLLFCSAFFINYSYASEVWEHPDYKAYETHQDPCYINPCPANTCYEECYHCDIFPRCCVALPGSPPLMPSFLADPRRIGMSAGWRVRDRAIDNGNSGPVSFGDYAGLVRWCNPFCRRGVLEIGIEGDLYAIFQQTRESAPLVNADYYVGIPVTYAIGCWAFRMRLFHISSHLGDEFLLLNDAFDASLISEEEQLVKDDGCLARLNPSSEYLDFFVTWRPNCNFRLFAGIGAIFRSDDSFPFKWFYAHYGFDYYFPFLRWYMPRSCVLGRPFFGSFFRTRQDDNFRFDGTFVLGYEWSRMYCDYKKIRLFAEYHSGTSYEGQFSRIPTNYLSLTVWYGY